jgi:hypothetical protein
MLGTRRRAELTDATASSRLHELVEQGLLELEPYQEPGQRLSGDPSSRSARSSLAAS